jgi:hypothetical protein
MVDDILDQDFELQLLNDAKNQIEADYTWEILKKLNSSHTAVQGTTQSTTYPLPADMAFPIKVQMLTDRTPYMQINYEDQYMFVDVSRYWFMDYANNVFAFTGTIGMTDTILFFYQRYTDDIELNTSWVFPERFHKILPYKMAEIYYAIDAGEKGRAWDDRWSLYYNYALQQMQLWDAKLKEQAKVQNYVDSASNPLVAYS